MTALPKATLDAQEKASDPSASAWVSANAGSGKTTVLVRRAIRLMMADTPPARILCLTYTKAAAAHMANEVLKALSAWVRLDDAALDKELAAIDPAAVSDARRARARRLFAAALETPGGLKVQTIHAFCERVLHQFPFEAGVPAGFEVLDELGERDLLARARLDVFLDAAAKPDSALGQALARAVAVASDQRLSKTLDEAVRERRRLMRFFEHHGANRDAVIAAALELATKDTPASIEKEIAEGPLLPRAEWPKVAAKLQALDGNARKRGEALAAATASSDFAAAIEEYFSTFFTDEGKPRADGGFGNQGARAQQPELFARLLEERDRLVPLREKRAAASARERSAALLTLAEATIGRYEEMKAGRGALDFGDLVGKTADLLSNTAAAWVHYKLDGGIDHILIDEAQDTSPEQWTVIEKLAGEFFAGRGARENRNCTIFAVGDEKQSIFSFQGADPARFAKMQSAFKSYSDKAKLKFHDEKLNLSFRSMPGVLEAVDLVFKRPEAHRGLSSSDPGKTVHETLRKEAPALVELWPTVTPDPKEDDGLAWDAPLDARAETSPAVKLARQIAAAVKHWTKGALAVTDRKTQAVRTARAGDVIVLVRRRGPLFEAVLRALKDAGVAVAGADRLDLVEHIAVMDLLALADALLLEHDDLSLACALKSPLFGLSEDDLFALAHGRPGTLAAALAGKAKTEDRFKDAADRLAGWRKEARELRPFDFYSRVLGRDRGRELILGRLGDEAADAIDELLARALAYERTEAPTLAGFTAFLRRAGTEVKRDLEIESDAVRVMTVHGVKGLEAPIIVLADTTWDLMADRHDPSLLSLPVPNAPPDTPEAPVWMLSSKFDSPAMERARTAARAKRAEEYRRLLYVAVTRARDALIVCGHDSKPREEAKLPDSSWYRLVYDALKPDSEEHDAPGFEGKVWRAQRSAARTAARPEPQAVSPSEEPAWLRRPAPPAPPPVRVIAPSRLGPHPAAGRTRAAPAKGLDPLQRGELVHALLRALALFPEPERAARAKHFLAEATDVTEGERDGLTAEAIAVLDDPDCAMLFGENSQGEVPIFARWELERGPVELSGRIDRLAETEEAVYIADFKTDRKPPLPGDERFGGYVGQLALYREALRPLYPGKAVRAHLVWTVKPTSQEIPADALDAAFQRVVAT